MLRSPFRLRAWRSRNITAATKYTAVFNDGAEVSFVCSPQDDLWIALSEQLPSDDPTRWVEYVEDAAGELVEY
jgi:hypothetical protein